ncbi:winged helix-turn-helix domain-containing protein [Pseudomonas sp. TH34]|uniref:winged helix-turn-helix domain-containing protein n=1 Tax=Pseudomonas sp. TH34 TaxID=2796399 RepID=UPI001F5BFC8A|nr:winged helix-turn-helix domain-containing protein [Pseudomonas sp. TH34]
MTYSQRSPLEDSAFEIHFGPYRLLPRRHLLLKNGEPVSLGSRALTLLIALASRPGELLEKTQLLDIAWPRLVVEECNLRAQIKAIRRALGVMMRSISRPRWARGIGLLRRPGLSVGRGKSRWCWGFIVVGVVWGGFGSGAYPLFG